MNRKSGIPAFPAIGNSAVVLLQQYRRTARWQPLEYLFWLLPVLAVFFFPGHYLLLNQIAITCLFALSLDLIFGYAGIISLGHAAFFGIGAYTAGLLGAHGWGEPLSGLLLSALCAGLAGFGSSFLVLRGTDLSRLMVTLGIALLVYELANKLTPITGGVDGLTGIDIWPLLGMFEFDLYGKTAYLYSLLILFSLFCLARRLVRSPYGTSLRGIRMNVRRMPALGVPVRQRLVSIYTVAAIYAGVAGALLVQTNQFVSLEVLGFQRSAELLLMLILGGAGYLYGGMIGALCYVLFTYFLSDMNPRYWQFWLGLILVLIVLFARGGILGTAHSWLENRRKRLADLANKT